MAKQTTYQYSYTTPTKISYVGGKRKVIKKSKTISGGISRSSGGASESLKLARERATQQAQEEAKRKAIEQQQKIEQQKIEAERIRIANLKTKLILAKAQKNVRLLKDARTKQRIKVETLINQKTRERILTRTNLDTGVVTIRTFQKVGGGRRIFESGGMVRSGTPKTKEQASTIASKVKISRSNVVGKLLVKFPNGKSVNISSRGKVSVGARFAGKNYLFENGKIIAVDGKSTFAREEFIPQAEIQRIETPTGNVNKILFKLNSLQRKKSTQSIRTKQKNLINELSLLGLTIATTTINGIMGFVALKTLGQKLIQDPTRIKQLPGALKQIPGAVSKAGKSFGKLIIISPTEAIGVLAGEYILFKGSGLAFRAVGKVSSKTIRIVKPVMRKADTLAWKITGKTIKISKKSKQMRRVISKVKKVKALQKKEISKFRSSVEYSKQLSRAKKIRKLARKKGESIRFGDKDFIEGVAFIEDVADKLAITKAKQLLKHFKAGGGKLGLGQEEDFIRAVQRYVKTTLNSNPNFKRLKDYSKLTEPLQLKVIKINKLSSARNLVTKINQRMKSSILGKRVNSIFKRVIIAKKKIKKFPQKMKKKITTRKLQKIARKQFRQTNRYRMDKARKIRKVTIQQLEKSSSINQYRKFVDSFFDEIGRRQKIKIGSLKYRQFKNIIKKRLTMAIKSGDKLEIQRFKTGVKKIVREMNSPSKAPTIKVVKKRGKSFKTIKDFKPETPKGKYVEVKQGQQVLLQEVKQIQKTKTVQKLIQKPQTYIIRSVEKQAISLKPMLQFGVMSLSSQAVRQVLKQKTKQFSSTSQLVRTIARSGQASAQDIRVLQSIGKAIAPRLNIAQVVRQAVASKQRFKKKQITKQITKKTIIKTLRIPEKFRAKSLRKSVPVYYVRVKTKGRIKNLTPRPLTLTDAKDFLAYRIDHRLSRSAWFEPIGTSKKVVGLPKSMKGYFSKNKNKLRPFKIRVGKKKQIRNGYIEKIKYNLDKKSEVKALALARKRIKRRKVVKKRVSKRKTTIKRKKLIKRRK